ncbi:unnamed protein product [Bubo scandiacus]
MRKWIYSFIIVKRTLNSFDESGSNPVNMISLYHNEPLKLCPFQAAQWLPGAMEYLILENTEEGVAYEKLSSNLIPFKQAPKKAKKKIEGGSNVFSMFEQTQIQEFKEAFTIMDQNRDGFIDKADLRDTFAALGRLNVKNEELENMVKEAPGPINFTVFLTMFGEKLKGTDPEETILNAFKIFDPEGKGHIKADYIKEMLMTQADRFSQEEIKQMFAAFPPDVSGNLDYKNLCYVITHGEEKD